MTISIRFKVLLVFLSSLAIYTTFTKAMMNRTQQNSQVTLPPTFWQDSQQVIYRMLKEMSTQGNCELAAEELIDEIVETSQNKNKLKRDFEMLRGYLIPSLFQYQNYEFPHEKAAGKMILKYISTVRPFEKGNIIELWSMLKRIHPLTEHNANAIFQVITDTDFDSFYLKKRKPLWRWKVYFMTPHRLDWVLFNRDRHTAFCIAKENVLEKAFSDHGSLEKAIEQIPDAYVNFFSNILARYYAYRYPVIDEMPEILKGSGERICLIFQRTILEKIRQGLLSHDDVPYLLELLLEVLKNK